MVTVFTYSSFYLLFCLFSSFILCSSHTDMYCYYYSSLQEMGVETLLHGSLWSLLWHGVVQVTLISCQQNLLPQGHLKWILSLPPCLTHFFLTVKECLPAFCLSPSLCFSSMPYWIQGSPASTQSPWGSAPNKGFLASPQFYRSVIWDVRLQVNSRCLPTSAFGFYPFRWLSLFCYGTKHVP